MKKNCNTNQLDAFATIDFKSQQRYVYAKSQCYKPTKFQPVTALRVCKRQRYATNSDCTGLDISFDRKMNDFTNPKSSEAYRERCCQPL